MWRATYGGEARHTCCSATRQAAARGSAKQASGSGTPSGTRCRLATGRVKYSAIVPYTAAEAIHAMIQYV